MTSILINKENKLKKLKNIILIIGLSAFLTLEYILLPSMFRLALSFLTIILTNRLLFKENLIKSSILSFINFAYFLMAEIVYFVLLFLFQIDGTTIYTSFGGLLLINIVINLIVILLFQIKLLHKISIKILNYDNGMMYLKMVILIILSILFYKHYLDAENINDHINVLLIAILYIAIMFISFRERIDNDTLSCKYNDLLIYMRKYEKEILIKNIKSHEFKNQIITIKGLIPFSNKEAHRYIDSIINEVKLENTTILKDLSKITNNGVKGLLYYKLGPLEKDGIQVYNHIICKAKNNILLKLSTESYRDFLKIMGIYLDNAIDASKKSLQKSISVELTICKSNLSLIISNTYKGNIRTSKLNEPFTTKGRGRGHGLLLANELFNKYKYFHAEQQFLNNYYSISFTINLPKK